MRRSFVGWKTSRALPTDLAFEFTSGGSAVAGQDFQLAPSPGVIHAGRRNFAAPFDFLTNPQTQAARQLDINVQVSAPGGLSRAVGLIEDAAASTAVSEDSYSVAQGSPLVVTAGSGVTANDTGKGTVSLRREGPYGTTALEPTGAFTWTPPSPNFIGKSGFSYLMDRRSERVDVVSGETTWKWLHPLDGVSPAVGNPAFATTWSTLAFDDTAWASGSGVFGYGGIGVDNAVVPDVDLGTPPPGQRYTAYFRTTFTAPFTGPCTVSLEYFRDDGVIFWLNGNRIGSEGIQSVAPADVYKVLAPGSTDGAMEVEVRRAAFPATLLPGVNVLAVSLHNRDATSSDLALKVISCSVEPAKVSTGVWATIEATDAHVPPRLQPDEFTVDGPFTFGTYADVGFGVLENDDLWGLDGADYDPILEVIPTQPSHGTLDFESSTGHFRYTPEPGWFGRDSFTYRVRDKDGISEPATVRLTVTSGRAFGAYQAAMFGTGIEDPRNAPDADPDGDGVDTAIEFAFERSATTPEFEPLFAVRPVPDGWRVEASPEAIDELSEFALESSSSLVGPWEKIWGLRDGRPVDAVPGVHGGRDWIPSPWRFVLLVDDLRPQVDARFYRFTATP